MLFTRSALSQRCDVEYQELILDAIFGPHVAATAGRAKQMLSVLYAMMNGESQPDTERKLYKNLVSALRINCLGNCYEMTHKEEDHSKSLTPGGYEFPLIHQKLA
ncbi:hypothetical protein QE152_g4461 [Popillia japonica]|uniref:Uncharacterized protein n=1 Tax=Popillia japonica TaxID=7064 RepID=A0AAW1N0Q0_POPJA